MGVVFQHHQLLRGNEFEECHAVGFYVIVVVIVWKFAFCSWFKHHFHSHSFCSASLIDAPFATPHA